MIVRLFWAQVCRQFSTCCSCLYFYHGAVSQTAGLWDSCLHVHVVIGSLAQLSSQKIRVKSEKSICFARQRMVEHSLAVLGVQQISVQFWFFALQNITVAHLQIKSGWYSVYGLFCKPQMHNSASTHYKLYSFTAFLLLYYCFHFCQR